MSRKNTPTDNAIAERFMRTFKVLMEKQLSNQYRKQLYQTRVQEVKVIEVL